MMRVLVHSHILNPQTGGSRATEILLLMVKNKTNKKKTPTKPCTIFELCNTQLFDLAQPTEIDGCVTHADAEDGDVSKLAEVPAAKRKTVKRPQPKLDSSRYDT